LRGDHITIVCRSDYTEPVGTRFILGTSAARIVTAVATALLLRTVWFTDTLATAVAEEPGDTITATPAAAICTALLTGTIGSTLTDPRRATYKTGSTVATTPSATVFTTLLVDAIWLAAAISITLLQSFSCAEIVPGVLAAERVHFADTHFDILIITARRPIDGTTIAGA